MIREYNLIDEPWIVVRTEEGKIDEVSLKDALLFSHKYIGLAGETKTQDFAVFRMMLAVLYTVFSRYDVEGNDIDLVDDPSLALDQWKTIWDSGSIPKAPIERYFSEWHDRFWLIDEEYPFYQSISARVKKECATGKMIGTLFESNNKARLFSDRYEEGRNLTLSEATRWLLHLTQFDDIAAKDPTPKKTWCGKLSLIALIGNNLFQTLMLNYRADYDANREEEELPSWETDRRKVEFNHQIVVPRNQAELLTLQSRNAYLCVEKGMVTAYKIAGGDWFEDEMVFQEQMTLWSGTKDKKASHPVFKPKRYDISKMIWQEFASISSLVEESNDTEHYIHPAGVVEWLHELLGYSFLPNDFVVRICNAAVIYDFKQANSLPVLDVVSDSVSFHSELLEEIGAQWRQRIIDEIGKIDKAAGYVYLLYKNLQKASGRRDKDAKETHSGELDAKREYYARIDLLFRLWLAGLNPDYDLDIYTRQLESDLHRVAIAFGRELAGQIGSQSVFCAGEISLPQAMNYYEGSIRKLFTVENINLTEVSEI